jgi:hypothetical protein
MSGIDAVFKSQLRPLDTDGPEEKGALVKNPSGARLSCTNQAGNPCSFARIADFYYYYYYYFFEIFSSVLKLCSAHVQGWVIRFSFH